MCLTLYICIISYIFRCIPPYTCAASCILNFLLHFIAVVFYHTLCLAPTSFYFLLERNLTGGSFESNEFQNDICVSYKIMFSQSFAFFILSCFHDMSSFPSYFAFRSKLPQGSQETFISLFLMIYKTI